MQKICVFTGTRAEYGLLKPLIQRIAADPDMNLQILVSGTHLSEEFGFTVHEIENDGFTVDEKIEILMSSDSAIGVCKSLGIGLISLSEALQRLNPEILIVLGDRYEALAAALTSLISRIPVAHIHGGETTFGVIDEAIRHAITKMAYYHFTSTRHYRKRVIQLGEHPNRVFHVGALGIDNIKNLKLIERAELENVLGINLNRDCMLITFHPATLDKKSTNLHFEQVLKALDMFPNITKIFTKSNADAGSRQINKMIDDYVKQQDLAIVFHSLGRTLYLNVLRHMKCIVGNSSSGIIEAPSLKIATVNIGDRQAGRIRCESVIDCLPEKNSICRAIETALSAKFHNLLAGLQNPYEKDNTAALIADKLKSFKVPDDLKKTFYDIPLSS